MDGLGYFVKTIEDMSNCEEPVVMAKMVITLIRLYDEPVIRIADVFTYTKAHAPKCIEE